MSAAPTSDAVLDLGWDLPGQSRAAEALRGAVARGEVVHAWALLGAPGVGQDQAVRTFAAALNCPGTVDGVPDGTCDVCRRCARGAYPALEEFAPAGSVHRVAEVREQWLAAAFRTASEGRAKVLRVLDADRMNEAAANAFLKGLEEPPASTVWILDVADPDELPDTILSRCRTVRFVPWSTDALDAEARRLGVAEDARGLAVRASLGSPVVLRRLASPGGLDDLRAHRGVVRRLREQGSGVAVQASRELDDEGKRRTAALKAEGKAELAALAELYADAPPRGVVKQVEDRLARREREARLGVLQAALDDLAGCYRDLLLVGGGGEAAIGDEGVAALRVEAEALGPSGALRALDLVTATRTDLELNVAPPLALEALLLELAALTRAG